MALSAPLLYRKRVIKVASETVRGTKVAGTQALEVFDLEINPTGPFQERRDTGLYRGPSLRSGIVGERSGKCSFKAELRGTGANGLEAGLAILLQACGFKKTSESYAVHSSHADDKTISIDLWQDGAKKGLAGASGNVTFGGVVGDRMFLTFAFSGIWQLKTDEALPAFSPSTTTPMFIQSGTFTLATQAIKIANFELDMGCDVVPRRDAAGVGGIAYYMIPDYTPIVKIDPEADLVTGYDFYGNWLAGTPAAIVLAVNDGAAAPIDVVTFTLPSVLPKEISEGERTGVQIENWQGVCQHSSGNDSVTIAVT